MQSNSPPGIEAFTIAPIPVDQRHGKARDLFTIWFGGNLTLLAVSTGILGTAVFGLSVWMALAALLLGNLVGAVVMALHAAQGPRMGIPQMLQTRAQFGSYGSLLVIVIVIVMYLGFFASSMTLGGQALAQLLKFNDVIGIASLGLLSVVAAIVGYRFIHMLGRVLTVASGVVVVLAIVMASTNDTVQSSLATGSFTWLGFMGAVSVGALWQIAYAPYVSDYSRYLPPESGAKIAFWATLGGTVIGSVLLMGLGVFIGAAFPDAEPIDGLTEATGSVSTLIVFIFAAGVACTNSMNLYCGALSTITVGQTIWPKWKPRAVARVIVTLCLFPVALLMSLVGKDDFLVNFMNFLLLLLCVLIPWTAINLVDYYLLKKGHYNIDALYRRDGGEYGRYNWVAISCYLIGIAVQIPFLSTHMYTGPAASALEGVDISWLVGLAVTCPVYYWWMKAKEARTATASSKAQLASQ
ncbi:cytosine permease [Mycobacterium sp. DL99]|uniref:purine-cytosine permease family protein n=1 Tax=Mycobacterium sp. DL99 TaxID=2528957 RepID=UPI001081E2A8|nr:cytosine permease [Mycobacterium sp. DL99]